jgi:hypothetical protein
MDLLPTFGYFDNAFKGYGYGHMEWTNRFLRAGHGGFFKDVYHYYAIKDDDLDYVELESFKSNEDLSKNWEVYRNKYYNNTYVPCPPEVKDDPLYIKAVS